MKKFSQRRNLPLIILALILSVYLFSTSRIEQMLPNSTEDEYIPVADEGNNLVKSPNFENLSDWTFYGNTDKSFEKTSSPPGLILFNKIYESTASTQVMKQDVHINQTIFAPIVISVWARTEVSLNITKQEEAAFLWDKLSIYADLELNTGKKLWGYSKVLSLSSDWQKNELTLDLDETLIKTVYLHVMFKVTGVLWISRVAITQMQPMSAIYKNTSLNLYYVPMLCDNIPEESSPAPLLVTAVILNWRRPVNLIAIISKLVHYPFLTEILIWNNNQNFTLQLQHFIEYNQNFSTGVWREKTLLGMNKIRIINSPNNLHDLGRWVACSQARNSICYIQDDDFENCFINSLYANLQLSPNQVHVVTMPELTYEHRRWVLWNPNQNLHAMFAWLGAGSFVPKHLAQHFLSQISHYSFEGQQLLYADMLFGLWNNDPAYKLSAPLKKVPSDKVGFSDTQNHWKIVFHTINRGARILHKELTKDPFTKIFNHKQSIPKFDDRTAHTICHNDKCILITNHKMLIPLKSSIVYNPSVSIREQEDYYASPSHDWFNQYGYHNAVDGHLNTTWQIVTSNTTDTFFFGLDLLRPQFCESILVHSSNWTKTMLGDIKVYTSTHGKEWKQMPFEFSLVNSDPSYQTLEISPSDADDNEISYRFFRIYLNQTVSPLFINEIETKCSLTNPRKAVIPRRNRPMVTAIYISWNRLNVWQNLLSHISKYDFVDEVIFWNNNANITFDHNQLYSYFGSERTDISLRVINSHANLYFFARFIGCSMAKNEICLFQDDDWKIDHLNSLYHNYLLYPNLLHSYTNPFVHYLCWTWSYMDASIDLHTTFNWLGTGGLVSKQHVMNFIETVGKLLPANQNIFADMFFATWLNDHHYQMSTSLTEVSNSSGFSAGLSGIARNKYYILQGSNILYEHLKSNKSTIFSREEIKPRWEDRVNRSPCSTDNCVFTSSILAFPPPRQLTTNFSLDFDGRALQFVEKMPKQQLEDWLAYPYHHAVDTDYTTCYYVRNSSQDDYFGLDLFSVQLVKMIYIRYEGIRSAKDWLDQFVLERMWDRDLQQWSVVNQWERKYIGEFWVVITLAEILPVESFRLKCIVPFCHLYRVCHLSINDDFKINP